MLVGRRMIGQVDLIRAIATHYVYLAVSVPISLEGDSPS